MKQPLIPVAQALARVLAAAAPVEAETVAIGQAHGRTLAQDVRAGRTQPPFVNSAMDGYALRAADAAAPGARLRVVGEAAAGRALARTLSAGEAARIFTGAPLPPGADSVAVQEEAIRDGDFVVLKTGATVGDNVRGIGLDFQDGEPLLSAGRRLTPRDVALIAAANLARVSVRRRPRIAVLSNGDELKQPGEPLGPADIVASNHYFVSGLVAAQGGEVIDLGVVADDSHALANAIAAAQAARADVLVTLGGASVGEYDLVQKALVDAGMELGFWRIAMRPGKPLMFGRLGAMLALGLPGNPSSSAVCGLLFLRPLIRALLGDPSAGADPAEPARLGAALPANGPRQDYMRASLTLDARGEWIATPLVQQDSSLVRILAEADALLVRTPFAAPALGGELCSVLRLIGLGG